MSRSFAVWLLTSLLIWAPKMTMGQPPCRPCSPVSSHHDRFAEFIDPFADPVAPFADHHEPFPSGGPPARRDDPARDSQPVNSSQPSSLNSYEDPFVRRAEPAPAPALDVGEPIPQPPQAPPACRRTVPPSAPSAQPTFAASHPTTASQPAADQQPATVSQPVTIGEPAAISDDATGSQPVKLLRPTLAPAPAPVTISALDDAPPAIGDFFGGGSPSVATFNGGNPIVVGSAAAAGGTVGRQKFAENASPIPRDRVFLNYSHVNGAQLTARGTDVNRFVPGFEKTFRGGDLSFEFRAPFASTADSTFLSNGHVDQGELEWGDLTFFLKALLLYDGKTALTGGVGFSFPTHDDLVVLDELNGTPLINMDNTAVHALPYLAALWTPNDELFVQLFGQIDVDLNGNDVTVAEGNGAGGYRFVHAGRLQDQTYLFLDLVAGYWIYQNPCSDFRGIAPVVELHFNRSLNDADFVFSNNGTGLSARDNDLSLLNTVVGVHMFLKDNLQVHAGYGFPLSGADDQFDGEFRVGMNWLFGPAGGGPFRRLR